jgi:hypothetical protein
MCSPGGGPTLNGMETSVERVAFCILCRAPAPSHADDCPHRVIILESEVEDAELEAALAAAAHKIVHPQPGRFVHESSDSVYF